MAVLGTMLSKPAKMEVKSVFWVVLDLSKAFFLAS